MNKRFSTLIVILLVANFIVTACASPTPSATPNPTAAAPTVKTEPTVSLTPTETLEPAAQDPTFLNGKVVTLVEMPQKGAALIMVDRVTYRVKMDSFQVRYVRLGRSGTHQTWWVTLTEEMLNYVLFRDREATPITGVLTVDPIGDPAFLYLLQLRETFAYNEADLAVFAEAKEFIRKASARREIAYVPDEFLVRYLLSDSPSEVKEWMDEQRWLTGDLPPEPYSSIFSPGQQWVYTKDMGWYGMEVKAFPPLSYVEGPDIEIWRVMIFYHKVPGLRVVGVLNCDTPGPNGARVVRSEKVNSGVILDSIVQYVDPMVVTFIYHGEETQLYLPGGSLVAMYQGTIPYHDIATTYYGYGSDDQTKTRDMAAYKVQKTEFSCNNN